MKLRLHRRQPPSEGPEAPDLPAPLRKALTQRQFIKLLLGSAGAAGLGLAASPQAAQATYTAGSPSDIVDTNLTVQGNLVVTPGNVGIGTSSPQGKLDVAGDIRVNGTQAIGSDGVVKQSYYAP